MQNKIKTIFIPLFSMLILLLMILWMAGTFTAKIKPQTLAAADAYQGKTITLARTVVNQYEYVSATVQSNQSVTVAARMMAPIKAIHVKAGDQVNQGDLLIELDDRSLRADVARNRENVNAGKARMLQAKSHYQRTKTLYSQEAVTQADFEKANASYDSSRAQLASARQSLQASETLLSYGRITTAFKARVIDRYAEPGDMATPGMKLLSLYDPELLRIEANVRESLALTLKLGQSLTAQISALNIEIPATIEEIVPAANPGARSFLIKAKVAYQAQLLPGMFARIKIATGKTERLLIPQSYIQQVGQLDMVWVLQENKAIRRFIRLGRSVADKVTVTSGLSAGEKLIVPKTAR
jgi:RND family efflux transporter MFP subunit